MKKKLKYIILVIIIVGILSYLLLTPIGAIRFAVLRYGYPINAITLKLSNEPCRPPIDTDSVGYQTVYTIINYPVEERTQTPFESWVVSKYGPFYLATVYIV